MPKSTEGKDGLVRTCVHFLHPMYPAVTLPGLPAPDMDEYICVNLHPDNTYIHTRRPGSLVVGLARYIHAPTRWVAYMPQK